MSRYGQYGYYDPVGSGQSQPTGYTYQSASNAPSYPSAATTSGYGNSQQQGYGHSGYGGQTYSAGAQSNNTSTSHAAAALSSLGNQDYNQTSNRNASGQYENNQWYGSNATASYGNSSLQPNRSQANNSPLYASAQGSTFARLSVPEQSQSSSNTYGSSSTYQNAPSNAGTNYRYQSNNTSQTAQNPPQRYPSPLHAIQAQQQNHQKQASRGSNHQPSPQMANAARQLQQNRQQSASVEPSPVTVDPSQVYDNRAELERKARPEAERRRKIEAEQAARKAEEDQKAAEREREKAEEASRKAAEEAEAAKKKKDAQARKNEQRRKAREEKQQSKSAATTLQQMASMGAESSASGAGGDEEAEMRAMFKKMREFNSKNPAMLAKLWEEERTQHAISQSPPAAQSSTSVAQKATPAPVTKNTHSKQSAAQAQPKSAPPPNKVPPPPAPKPTAQQTTATVAAMADLQTASDRPMASSNASLWPPHKKGALADATAKWLMGLSENSGKSISQQAVLNILDTNPSYVQLCESLENLDMKFERSTLARELLKAVPDGLRPQKPSTPAANSSAAGARPPSQTGRPAQPKPSAPTGTVTYSTPLSLSDAAREVNQMHKSTPQYGGGLQGLQRQSPLIGQSQTLTNGSRPPSQPGAAPHARAPPAAQSDVKPMTPSEEPRRDPADKEEAARKRTFGDLVDLTNGDDSDDEGPPAKKVATVPANGLSKQYRDPLAYLANLAQPQKAVFQQPYQPKPLQNSAPEANMMRSRPLLPSNAPASAVQTPTMPPKPKGPSAEAVQQSRMRGRMLVEPIMRDRVARKSRYDSATIARDVLLATGRHPDMRGLNHHLAAMQKLLGHHGGEVDSNGTKCDLSTIRWDVIDPGQPVNAVDKPQNQEQKASRERSSDNTVDAPTPPALRMVHYEAPFAPHDATAEVSSAPPKVKKKLGRPRKSDSAARLGECGTSNTPARDVATSTETPDASELLEHANDMAASGTPVGYSAFRQIGPDGQVIKKKGRPVGWKKSIHSREAQGLPPAHTHKKAPAGPSNAAKKDTIVEPQWQSFYCQWENCKAELQNLDTLKKHLLKVHGREMDGGRGYQCLWKDCDRQPAEGGGFSELEDWLGHVDKAHLRPIAWKQGDGPRGGSLAESPFFQRNPSERSSPAYLNDAYGRSVTPIIEAPQSSSDEQEAGAEGEGEEGKVKPKAKALPIHSSKLEREAEDDLQKLRQHKMLVGLTMDRQGCVMASEARRKTFLGDEDFEDVVQAGRDEGEGCWD